MSAAAPKRPILVVDDEPDILFSLKALLRKDFEVFTAASAEEGVQILERHIIHVVMTDQRMPQVTGVEFLSRIKSEHPAAMRLIFTGYADINAVIDAINQGSVFRYIAKPWDPDELIAALQDAGRRYDQLAQRNELLDALRNYERRCITFADGVLEGRLGSLVPEAVTEARTLVGDGQALLQRLDSVLAIAAIEPAK